MLTTSLVRRLSAASVLILLSACGLPEPAASPRANRYRADLPLVARIQTTGTRADGLRFYLNRPAHVALFEVVPGRGVGLLYPSGSFETRTLSSGVHLARTYNTFFRGSYLPVATSLGTQPRYILLVASERPLRLEEIQRSPERLRSMLGLQHFASYNPYNTMERLAESVLPAAIGDDWTTDVFVEWPQAPARAPMQLVRVQCPSGQLLVVPFDQAREAVQMCDAFPQAKFIPQPANPDDSSAVRPPRRTRPVAEDNPGPPSRDSGRQSARDAETPREPRVARPRTETSEPRVRHSPPREVPAQRTEPRSEPRPAPRSEPRTESRPAPRAAPETRVEPSQPRVERPTPSEQR